MDLRISGQRAIVTGSTAGIGHAIAQRLAGEGAEVIITGRTQARVDKAVATLLEQAPSGRVRGLAADLGTEAGCRTLIEATPDAEILVNNVGVYGPKPFEEITARDWQEIFATNVISGALLSQHYLPRMLARGAGRVIFISSESAVQIPAEMIHYGVTKTAQSALARGLAELTRGTAVTVNSVLVGPTRSEGVDRFVTDLASSRGASVAQVESEFFTTTRPTSLLGRFITTEEVANVVAFLASGLAAAVNGAAVRAEGGLLKGVF
ncbi:SDR family NAD(P)-dependent oxidoreductase [Sorangium sp. So ce362]|uniref:SDR family NAD(P)-dependent oxidoreductase n=1 Tax=Sorangium sp. So ce362 TaxID=3133303 RepID=UPI003F634E2F